MTFDAYQERTNETAKYPKFFVESGQLMVGTPWMYPAIGLAGETGELLEKLKKVARDNGGYFRPGDSELIKKEVGDVLWYLAQICEKLGFHLDDCAQMNLAKLADRASRGTIGGSGDTR